MSGDDNPFRCSFCRKSNDVVRKLIASPTGDSRAYICDECVMVCADLLSYDHPLVEHPLIRHPLSPQLLEALDRWIARESSGADASDALSELRHLAMRIRAGDQG